MHRFSLILVIFCNLYAYSSRAQNCQDDPLKSQVEVVLPDCNKGDGSILIYNTRGGVPPYTYRLDTAKNENGFFTKLPLGEYTVYVNDSRNCRDTIPVKMAYEDLSKVLRPYNTFTPNGDNLNDRWGIPGIERFQSSTVRVFNRWGQQIYVNSPYDNEFGWDGTQNGSPLPASTYYWTITVFNDCVEQSIAGTVTIIR
jgi:gliding motility-associated-like protein